jgi:GcrA cell cycle regulator
MKLQGWTAAQAAAYYGITRNAMLGKWKRMGLCQPRPAPSERPLVRPPAIRQRAPKPALGRAERLRRGWLPPEVEAVASALSPDDIPRYQRRTIETLGERHCRFPYGEPGKPDFFFCGGVAETNLPYCTDHCRVAFNGAPRRNLEHMKAA